jgi:DNA primase
MSSDFVQKVKAEVGIDGYISRYVKLTRRGKRFIGLCPFHKEKSPSFNVSPELKIYHCFGCGASGDIFKFIMDYDRVDFTRSLEIISEYSGIPIQKNENFSYTQKEKEEMYSINQKFLDYFRHSLKSEFGNLAKDYLRKRKIPESRIDIFKLGYSPKGFDNWKTLNLSDKEVSLSIKLGLLKKSDKEHVYDFFRDRIMFPIIDVNQKIAGFGGRIISESEEAKYINSPASLIYDKGKMFFNLNLAANSIRNTRKAILVEGYLDVIGLHSKEIENVVAPLGTAVTEKQIQKLKTLADNVLVLFDGDIAGRKAAYKATDICIKENLDSSVILLENKQDPFDLSQEKTKLEILEILSNPIPASTFIINESTLDVEPSSRPELKKTAIEKLFEFIKSLKTETEKESYLIESSKKLGLSYESLLKDFQKGKTNFESLKTDNKKEERKSNFSNPLIQYERKIVSLLILNPDLNKYNNELFGLEYEDQTSSTIMEWIKNRIVDENTYNNSDLIEARIGDDILKDLASFLIDDLENNESSLEEKENNLRSCLLQKRKISIELEKNKIDLSQSKENYQKYLELVNEKDKIEQEYKLLN